MVHAQLQTNLLRRNRIGSDLATFGTELFAWLLQDPHRHQQMLLAFTVVNSMHGLTGIVELTGWPELHAAGWYVSGRGEKDRIRIDPERLGVGVEQCSWYDRESHGYLASPTGVYTWFIEVDTFDQHPKEIERSSMLSLLTERAHALYPYTARVVKGQLEIWHGHGRHVTKQQIGLEGWQVTQLRCFGRSLQELYWLVTADQKGQVATFLQYATKLGPWTSHQQMLTTASNGGAHRIQQQLQTWNLAQRQHPFESHWFDGSTFSERKIFANYRINASEQTETQEKSFDTQYTQTNLRPCGVLAQGSSAVEQIGLLGRWNSPGHFN